MATDRHLERFRILNELEPNDRVRAGEQVKIVTERDGPPIASTLPDVR